MFSKLSAYYFYVLYGTITRENTVNFIHGFAWILIVHLLLFGAIYMQGKKEDEKIKDEPKNYATINILEALELA